jgi:hypothetical protein
MTPWSGMAGSVLVFAALGVAFLQSLLRLQGRPRPLTPGERRLLEPVFGAALACDRVRIVNGRSGLFGLGGGRPFALGDRVYMQAVDPAADSGTLVHECVHVWQFQHGGAAYAVDALLAQRRDGYDWRREIAAGRHRWTDWNPEAQAQMVEDVWRRGARLGPTGARVGGGAFFEAQAGESRRFVVDGVDYTALAADVAATLRNA